MKNGFFLVLLTTILLFNTTPFAAAKFYACNSKYALCTTAPCTPMTGKKDEVLCACDVKTGYSAATQNCQPVKQTQAGELVYSRYYPVKSYVTCTNNRPWAWCLDKPCIIDKKNPSKAVCACSVVSDLGPYVIVTDKNTATTCTTGIISSATIEQITDITDFLKTQPQPKPFPINRVAYN
ncbi:MAG TPA: hypothetical protein VHZ76_09145 [Gammaproteobacteria bacterium]|jgi:hypothetical protein|nr:hypothetical protein [Gammaproteobacteria bacterium]